MSDYELRIARFVTKLGGSYDFDDGRDGRVMRIYPPVSYARCREPTKNRITTVSEIQEDFSGVMAKHFNREE